MPATNRRRRWPFCLAAIAILAVTIINFPPMSNTKKQMLETWE